MKYSKVLFLVLSAILFIFIVNNAWSVRNVFDFNNSLAHEVRSSASANDKNKSAKLYKKAVSIHRKNKNPKESIPYFIQSIQLYPTGLKFFELGNAFMNIKAYNKAIQSHKISINLNYSKKQLVYYNITCSYSLSKNKTKALKYLELAFQNNYKYFNHVRKDRDLSYIQSSPELNNLINKYKNSGKILTIISGTWEGAPIVAERSPASYTFWSNGKFMYSYSGYNLTRRKESFSGTWQLKNSKLYLTVKKERIYVGGKIKASDIHQGEKVLENYKTVDRNISPNKILIYSLSGLLFDDKINIGKKRYNILINGKRYWKI